MQLPICRPKSLIAADPLLQQPCSESAFYALMRAALHVGQGVSQESFNTLPIVV